jgi:hypothetical protein
MRSAVASVLWAEKDAFSAFREHVTNESPISGVLYRLAYMRATRRRTRYMRLWYRMGLPTALRHAADPWSMNEKDYDKILSEWGDREIRKMIFLVPIQTMPVL